MPDKCAVCNKIPAENLVWYTSDEPERWLCRAHYQKWLTFAKDFEKKFKAQSSKSCDEGLKLLGELGRRFMKWVEENQ